MNPFADTLGFLFRSGWPTVVFWLLLAGSVAIALLNLYEDSEQRTAFHLWMWIARLFIGGLWWQQSLWKLPPTYTDNPDGISGGLHYWVGETAKHAAFGWQSAFVKDVLQPHFYLFAPQVYATDDSVAIPDSHVSS